MSEKNLTRFAERLVFNFFASSFERRFVELVLAVAKHLCDSPNDSISYI